MSEISLEMLDRNGPDEYEHLNDDFANEAPSYVAIDIHQNHPGTTVSDDSILQKQNSEMALPLSENVHSIIDWELGKREGMMDVLVSFLADQMGSIIMFTKLIFFTNPVDIIINSMLASGSTIFFYLHEGLAYDLNWTLLSIALVFPLTMTMTETFRRREQALTQLQILKSGMLGVFMAHNDWDWYTIPVDRCKPVLSGRHDVDSKEGARLSRSHTTVLKNTMFRFIDVMYTALTSPRISRARHYYTRNGIEEREYIQNIQGQLDDCCVHFFHDISKLGDRLKAAGLPAGEKTRISQFEQNFYCAYLQLRAIKDYRTPKGLRAFARMYIIINSILFGSYYADVANGTNLAFAIALSVITTAAMQGLFNVRHMLEDPFRMPHQTGIGTDDHPNDGSMRIIGDTIDLKFEFQNLKSDIQLVIDNKNTAHVDDIIDVKGQSIKRVRPTQEFIFSPLINETLGHGESST